MNLEGVTNVKDWSKVEKGRHRPFIQGLLLDALKTELSMVRACNKIGIDRTNVLRWIREQPDFKAKYVAICNERGLDLDIKRKRVRDKEYRSILDIDDVDYYLPAVSRRFLNSAEKVNDNLYRCIGKDGSVNVLYDGDYFYYESKDYPFEKGEQQAMYNSWILNLKRKKRYDK